MKPELDKVLCDTYPKIFRDRHGDMRQTCMVWGFECDNGWYLIINKLCYDIQKINDKEGFQTVAVQVKEKFGGLRFYVDSGNDEIYDLIDDAEKESERTCETCSQPGKIITRGWMYCACPDHTREEDK